MKWIFALNEPTEELVNHGKKYEYLAKIAVHSAKMHAPSLEPILLYNGQENEFTRELCQQGVEIVFHKLSFEAEIEACNSRDNLWRQTAKGAMLRLDIPQIIDSDEVVLYTDTDVLFLQDPTKYSLFTNFIAVAPEFDISDFSKINTGSMLINLKEARVRFKALIEWTVQNLHIIPDYDQGAIRAFFNGHWDRLDPVMNWKPYWGMNENAIILHFHGPKPSDFDLLTLQPRELSGVYDYLYKKDRLAYQYYVSKWIRFSHQRQLSIMRREVF